MVVDVEVEGRHGFCAVLSQFQDRRAVAAFAGVGGAERLDRGVPAEVLAQAVAQAPGPVAVDDAQARGAGQQRLIERLLDGVDRLVEPLCR